MVPPNWEHPKKSESGREESFQPMFNRPFAASMDEWYSNWKAWNPTNPKYQPDYPNYWDWSGSPPDPKYYRPDWKDGEATWFQVYETVSEGTPVTPPFATKEELIDYLVEHGDFWDQLRRAEGRSNMRCTPWPRKEAEAFVNGPGWAPSLIFAAGKLIGGTEGMAAIKEAQ
jgi:hypothetical protein